jgi:hypothetical protein
LSDAIENGEVALDLTTREALSAAWLQDAREEHASVAAFARWTMLMLSVGAPPDLVRGSQRASLDEIEHAKACFALACRYGAGAVGPADLDLTGALPSLSLLDIAVLTAEEGCVGETLGVALAMAQRDACEDPVVGRVLSRLIRDEERHARLAWAFVAFAIQKGGAPVRTAVIHAIRRAIRTTLESPIKTYAGVDRAAWRAHGRLTCAEARDVVIEASRLVLEPALAMLECPPAALHP